MRIILQTLEGVGEDEFYVKCLASIFLSLSVLSKKFEGTWPKGSISPISHPKETPAHYTISLVIGNPPHGPCPPMGY